MRRAPSSSTLLAECQGHTFPIWSVAFSPDGTCLVTGNTDRTTRVWDAVTGRELLILSGHQATVHPVAWSADGHRIITSSDDQTIKVWAAATPEEIAAWHAEEAEASRRVARGRETSRQ